MTDDKNIYDFLERLVKSNCGQGASVTFDYRTQGRNAPRIDIAYDITHDHPAGINPLEALERDLVSTFGRRKVHMHALESNDQKNGISVQGTEESLIIEALSAPKEIIKKIGWELRTKRHAKPADTYVAEALERVGKPRQRE